MAERVAYNNVGKILESRILSRLQSFQPSNPRMREGLTRIGIMIENEAKKNIRNKRIVDTGALLNSIRFRLYQKTNVAGVQSGSYGIPYAAAHEFGFNGPVTVRTHQRVVTQAFGRPIEPRVVDVTAHQRMMRVRERAYLRPAVQSVRKEILNIVKGLK